MWGKSIKVVVPLVFFLLWIWSHGSGTEGYWLCLLVMATRPWGVVASLDFHYQGKYREVFYREDVVFQKGETSVPQRTATTRVS